MRFLKLIFVAAATFAVMPLYADEQSDKIDYTPHIHGVVRARYEGEWPDYESRFQVRNARLSVEGKVLPSLDYYVRFDACDRGKMKFLDAWTRFSFANVWKVKAGQYRVPFGVDAFRGPGTYIFTNRSFIGKQMANVRQVGVQIGYYGHSFPLTVEGGVFNSAPMSDHEVWQKDMDYAAKVSYRLNNVTLSASYLSMKPYGVRMNLADGAVTWKWDRWIVEGEYQNEQYAHKAYKGVDAWNIFAAYALPLKSETFNRLLFKGRFDGMTDHSTGSPDDNEVLICNDAARQRLTLGCTLAFVNKYVKAEIMLDYEKYFYDNGVLAQRGQSDKIVAELIVKF